ncbi:MAG: hypothetical protein M0042_16800 [Nitrospiraceae bacterium]|nr:hypothetical protein [Nitrospiraceae bacterium]
MAEEQEKIGRCGWVALAGFVAFAILGLFTGSIAGGIAAVKASLSTLSKNGNPDLAHRMLVLAGMIAGLLCAAAVIMSLTILGARFVIAFRKRLARASAMEAGDAERGDEA